MAQQEWKPENFSRRQYTIEGDTLDKARRIRVRIDADGVQICDLQIREPGIIAIISRPNEAGIDLEVVEPGGVRYVDYESPRGDLRSLPPEDWQLAQLMKAK